MFTVFIPRGHESDHRVAGAFSLLYSYYIIRHFLLGEVDTGLQATGPKENGAHLYLLARGSQSFTRNKIRTCTCARATRPNKSNSKQHQTSNPSFFTLTSSTGQNHHIAQQAQSLSRDDSRHPRTFARAVCTCGLYTLHGNSPQTTRAARRGVGGVLIYLLLGRGW